MVMTLKNFAYGVSSVVLMTLLLGDGPAQSRETAPLHVVAQAPAPQAPVRRAPAPRAQTAPAAAEKAAEKPPVSSQPRATTASFGDWVMRCNRIDSASGNTTTCEVAQTLQVQGQGPIAEIAFGRPPGNPSATMRVVVVLPNNITIGTPVLMSVDDKDKPVELTYRRCLPTGCFADADARDDVLSRWRAQTGRGRLAFKDGANRDIALPFSFSGLEQALDALAKQ
jgi:invasion protein IalB